MQMRSSRVEAPRLGLPQRWARIAEWDRICALALNRRLLQRYERLWVIIDQLGDCGPWLVLIATLAFLGGHDGPRCAIHMTLAGGCAAILYKILKSFAGRPRPCAMLSDVRRCVEPLDEFSFPSGHTLHAVAFTAIAVAYFPGLAVLLLPFTLLTALSRVALGLHYPSDVVAGAAIGAALAQISFMFV